MKAAKKPKAVAKKQEQIIEWECEAGTTREQLHSVIAVAGVLANASTVATFSKRHLGECDGMRAVAALQKSIAASRSGDTSASDTLLIGQATALNAIFHEMMACSAANIGFHPDAMERYMRLGLKAQSQCRATLESLAKIKNPPNVAFVKQANIAHGPQQINNGIAVADEPDGRASETGISPIELLENSSGEWMDSRATGTAGGGDSAMAALGKVHRTKKSGGKS